jgi:hypothetical protein
MIGCCLVSSLAADWLDVYLGQTYLHQAWRAKNRKI